MLKKVLKMQINQTAILHQILHHHLLQNMNFNGPCSIKNNTSIPVSHTLCPQLRNVNTDFTLGNCSFVFLKLTKNADPDKYKHTGNDIGFDSRSKFLFTDRGYGENVIVFGSVMSSSVHVDNGGRNIFILGEGPTQDDTTLTAEAKYPVNFKICIMSTL